MAYGSWHMRVCKRKWHDAETYLRWTCYFPYIGFCYLVRVSNLQYSFHWSSSILLHCVSSKPIPTCIYHIICFAVCTGSSFIWFGSASFVLQPAIFWLVGYGSVFHIHPCQSRFSQTVNEEQQFHLDWTNNLSSLIHLPFLRIQWHTLAHCWWQQRRRRRWWWNNDDGDNSHNVRVFMWWTWSLYNVILCEQKKWLNTPQQCVRKRT